MRRFALFALTLVSLCGSAASHALPSFQVVPLSGSVDVGQTLLVDVIVDRDGSAIAAYDLDLLFDGGLLQYQAVTFGTGLGGPLDSLADAVDLGGSINAFEVSLLDAMDLLNAPAMFTLFTLEFLALDAGIAALDLVINDLADELGSPLNAEVSNATVDITAPIVTPAPATLWMVVVGLASLGVQRRRRGGRGLTSGGSGSGGWRACIHPN